MSEPDFFTALLERKEDLHEDLQPWIITERGFTSLKHPLLYEILYLPQMNALLNEQYKLKLQYIQEARAKRWPHRVVWMHERPWRLWAFQNCLSLNLIKDDAEYWELLKAIWVDSENIWQHIKDWRKLLKANRPKGSFMSGAEKRFLRKLPDIVTVWRGYDVTHPKSEKGLSYTLNRDRAKWFAERFVRDKKNARVVERVVPQDKIFAYTNSRNEQEIIIL